MKWVKLRHFCLGGKSAWRNWDQGTDSLPSSQAEQQGRGPELILSRSSLNFVRKLFEMEVAEISDGTVTLAAMAREPGYRTKVCVRVPLGVDPVETCVGSWFACKKYCP